VTRGKAGAAAATLWKHWQQLTRIDGLPADCRPSDRAEGYEVQAELVRLSGQSVAGWKIAATSRAGQKHINVDGPLAGPLLSDRVLEGAAAAPVVSLRGNIMNVAEVEFCFRLGADLPRRGKPYSTDEVLNAVESLHPAIEVPDSRYNDFVRAGAPQLIADAACACWFVLGPATRADWRARDLVSHSLTAFKNGSPAGTGIGANVLGDPRAALTWIANELTTYGEGLRAGDVVTTGTCVTPVPIAPGDRVRADFGDLGSVETQLA
jgi:2-keto-4-pentenoate hydratase